ncbi:ClbS/DfsB family four-helix bundle protein [Myroides pelagicus]|uniref:ClbS/DfsB family four-helix bundle protein n=1 Tax=Myroides pelagicus TaxID=270914 RepID=A0A7K1GSA5_9FLAO|nr:ClbS/DfsB family four-helix bundle protein [Myroides pelagicus]MEC4114530.1 ClbS/DfsB family four-helix bundle protein [Myroides pelagicus]MTH30794.1 ClbS/DfsB family four-helix bundle protein [Myroides pelagicus]
MARPTTKEKLLTLSKENFEKMFLLVESMSSKELSSTFAFDGRDRNIRDVFIHLTEWHGLLISWVKENQKGNLQSFLPEPYNWRTYPEMNVAFWKKHQVTSLEEAIYDLKQSHLKVVQLIESFTNEELFLKKHFAWTGTTSLGSYCVSATSSHYDWALKKLRKHQNLLLSKNVMKK